MSYKSSSRVQKTEEELIQLLNQLKSVLEEVDRPHEAAKDSKLSSLRIPKDIEHFRRERKIALERLMQIPELKLVEFQSKVLKEQLEVCGKMEYTPQNLAVLLHQFYVNRIEQLVQCKSMHQTRWTRYGSNTQVVQRLQGHYEHQMHAVISEYHDAIERAQRLADCMEQILAGGSPSPSLVTQQDVLIYLRYKVTELHSFKRANAYLRVVHLLPYLHENTFAMTHDKLNTNSAKSDHKEQVTASVRKKWQDVARRARYQSSDGRGTPTSQSPYSLFSTKHETASTTATTTTDDSSDMAGFCPSSEIAPASGGDTMTVPCNTTDLTKLRPLLEHLMACYDIKMSVEFLSSADELELFYIVNRKFKAIYQSQEEKLTFHTAGGSSEDVADMSVERKVFKKQSAWLPYVNIRPERMQFEDSLIGKLRADDYSDPLLLVLSHSLNLADIQKLQYALKRHAADVRRDLSNSSSQSSSKTTNIWKNIFCGFDPHDPSFNPHHDSIPSTSQEDHQHASSATIRLNVLGSGLPKTQSLGTEFDFGSAIQFLEGNEGALFGRKTASEPIYKDGFMSFLYLRHLRMRDLRIKCLSILNYFRSVQRTLTVIDSRVLLICSEEENGQSAVFSGASYVYNTPAECRLDWASAMESNESEYLDDFYSGDEAGCVVVQDRKGCHIMYDSAIDDFRHLEHQMLLVGSYYIELSAGKTFEKKNAPKEKSQAIDRFAVLFDLWNQEAAYLDSKRKLLNCYLEAYHNVFDPNEKRNLAQVMTNVMFSRPRFDASAEYFIHIYQEESLCLQLQKTLVVKILNKQIDSQRQYLGRILSSQEVSPEENFGLPLNVILQQPIALTDASTALNPVHLLEFHPSLCLASRLSGSLSSSLHEVLHMFKAHTPFAAVKLHIQLLRTSHQEFDLMKDISLDYTKAIQDNLFCDIVCEDPRILVKICVLLCQCLQQHGQLSQLELSQQQTKVWTQVLELIQLRHHLIDVCHETALLVKIYKLQASDVGFGLHNAFVRPVQLEQSAGVVGTENRIPSAMGLTKQDDATLDRFSSTLLSLAVHELDENQVGTFSFRSKLAIEQLLNHEGIKQMQTVLKAQTATRAAFTIAVQQNVLSHLARSKKKTDGTDLEELLSEGPDEQDSSRSSATAKSDSGPNLAEQILQSFSAVKHRQFFFLSVQLLKSPVMQEAMVQYSRKPATVLNDPKERAKAKCDVINTYSETLVSGLVTYSLRNQISALLDSTHELFGQFPAVRNAYFQVSGDPVQEGMQKKKQLKKQLVTSPLRSQSEMLAKQSDITVLDDPRKVYMRPRQMISLDGKRLLNLWYLPHFGEVFDMCSDLSGQLLIQSLQTVLRIVSSLHTIAMFITTYARLGESFGLKVKSNLQHGTSWGGAEHLGSELQDLQNKITHLSDPQDPLLVADYLEYHSQVLFQSFYVAIACNLRDSLLHSGYERAFQDITDGMKAFLHVASKSHCLALTLPMCAVPEPFVASSKLANNLFPRRSFLSRVGLKPCVISERCRIEQRVYTCLSCLDNKGRELASGELMAVNLLLEDVLDNVHKEPGILRFSHRRSADSGGDHHSSGQEVKVEKAFFRSSTDSAIASRHSGHHMAGIDQLKVLKEMLQFLKISSQLESLKQQWAQHLLELHHPICTTKHFRIYEESYCMNVLESVKHAVLSSSDSSLAESRRLSFQMPSVDLEKINISETKLRWHQVSFLLELLECHMIEDMKRHFDKLHDFVLAERLRDDDNLPLDLWKTVQTKEMCMVQRPLLVEEFSMALLSAHSDLGDTICFQKDHLNSCLTELAANVMHREKMVFRSYSSFYESMLRQQFSALQVKQKEVEKLNDALKASEETNTVELNCQLAEKTLLLLQQIGDLKAKVRALEKQSKLEEMRQQESMKRSYDDLVHKLFSSSTAVKGRFEEYRTGLYDDMINSVRLVRSAAIEGMRKIRRKAAAGLQHHQDENDLEQSLLKADCDLDIQRENALLTEKLLKLQTINAWKHNSTRSLYGQQLSHAQEERDEAKTELFNLKIHNDDELKSLEDQIVTLRKTLQLTEEQCQELKKQLTEERKIYSKRIQQLQEMSSQPRVDRTRQQDIEHLSSELQNHRQALRAVSEQREMSERRTIYEKAKSQKTARQLQQQLEQERSLKREAFHLVNDLQEKVNDYETLQQMPSRSIQSAPAGGRVGASPSHRRPLLSSRQSTRPAWPSRSNTPDPSGAAKLQVKLQRPKTSAGQLRSRLAESLMSSAPTLGLFGEEEVRALSEGNLLH
ncbi:uncharacterized protein LOC134191037 isoform X2 [Corticium candelabrum]|uniref:uncharacterized protein LOC134191037 isoform X2 n=1 Tax=Corticium candelabrum TaxID=121492 RepID=UPI002E275B1B|nr:uncharacterized protein LOC134191037 isoform X2 [Corticium candelabrum]